MKTKIEVPERFRELFLPNHTAAERNKFTQGYKTELKRKLMRGESITEEMLGVKSFVLKGGRISGKTMNDELATIPDFFGESGDIWYCRSEENTIRRSIFQSMQSTLRMRGFTLPSDTERNRVGHTGLSKRGIMTSTESLAWYIKYIQKAVLRVKRFYLRLTLPV